jgi:hypothetical protein
MLRDQTINFLEAVVVVLVLTNALSVLATVHLVRASHGFVRAGREAKSAVERRLDAIIARAG